MAISTLEALQVLVMPASLIADSDLVNILQPQTFFPNRDGQPQGALVVFKPVSADPRRTPRELNIVQDDKDVRERRFVEEAGIRTRIRLIGRDNHVANPNRLAAGPFRPSESNPLTSGIPGNGQGGKRSPLTSTISFQRHTPGTGMLQTWHTPPVRRIAVTVKMCREITSRPHPGQMVFSQAWPGTFPR